MPDSSRRLLTLLSVVAVAAACLTAPPVEAAGRSYGKSGRHLVKASRTKSAKAADAGKLARDAKPAAIETSRTEPAGVWTSGEQDRACFRGRRKLWQPGEGWVVKKVNLCP